MNCRPGGEKRSSAGRLPNQATLFTENENSTITKNTIRKIARLTGAVVASKKSRTNRGARRHKSSGPKTSSTPVAIKAISYFSFIVRYFPGSLILSGSGFRRYAFADRIPLAIALAAQKLIGGHQRRNICEHEVLREHQQPAAHANLLQQPGEYSARITTELCGEH